MVAPFAVDLLQGIGCIVVGPAPNMAAARELIEQEHIDAALMDVHIRGERVFSLCDALHAKGVSFVLSSGYGDWQLPEKWQDVPRLQKPYTIEQVEQAISAALAA